MTKKLHHKLKEKGWNDADILHAKNELEKATSHDIFFSKIVFWSALIVVIFANLIVSLILIPVLTVLNQYILYALVVILAGSIGFLYNFLITDIGHLKKHHHISASIIIPILAIANMIIMVVVSNNFISKLAINNAPHNPYILSIIFAVAFIIPSLIGHLRQN